MAHVAWAAMSVFAVPPDFDIRSTMSIAGAPRNSITWSDCSTLVDLPAVSPEFARPTSSPQQTPTSPYAPAAATGLLIDWLDPWASPSSPGDDTRAADGDRRKRKRMVQAWQKVKTRLIGAKAGGAPGEGDLHSPSSPPPPPAERQLTSESPRDLAHEHVHFAPRPAGNNRRRMTEYRPRRSASFTGPSNPARHSWHSSSSSSGRATNSPGTVEMVWGSMAAGFII